MSSISPRTLDDLTVAVSSLSKALQHPVHYTGDSRSISRAVKYCYLVAKNQLAQPITDEQIQNISNEYVWCYIIEMGPIHLAWFGPSTSINQACARVRTLMTFMQDRLRGDALSNPDAHSLVQCVDAILEAYDEHIANKDSDSDVSMYESSYGESIHEYGSDDTLPLPGF
jgi:hypothetical protein